MEAKQDASPDQAKDSQDDEECESPLIRRGGEDESGQEDFTDPDSPDVIKNNGTEDYVTAGKEAYQVEKMEVGVLDKRGPTLVIHGNDIVNGAFSKDFTPQSLGATSLNTDLINHAVIPPLALKNGSL